MINAFFLILAGVFAVWQVLLYVGALILVSKNYRGVEVGLGPLLLAFIFLALGLFL